MAYNSRPHCAYPGCTKMPVVQVYGFRRNEYSPYCEEHRATVFPVSGATGYVPMEERMAALEQRVAALAAEIASLKAREG